MAIGPFGVRWDVALIVGSLALLPIASAADESIDEVLDRLRDRASVAADLPDAERTIAYRDIRDGLDRIVTDHPASKLAVDILLRRPLLGLDLSEIHATLRNDRNTRIAARQAAISIPREPEISADDVADGTGVEAPSFDAPDSDIASLLATAPENTPEALAQSEAVSRPLPVGTEATEAAIGLDRQAIRDLQARLLVSGHDPNGVDGQIGRGTRGAVSAWQTSEGIEPTGYLTSEQLARLHTQSQAALDVWLRDSSNARQYTPPAPISLTPQRIAGTWDFTSRCGSDSRLGRITIRGVLSVVHAGGDRYTGRAQQSQGFRGDFSGQLNGRTLDGAINWGLLVGRTGFRGRVADQSLTLSGSDTNRCAFSARKR